MWASKGQGGKKPSKRNSLVAVAIDKDKASQYALRWAVDNLLSKGHPVILIHVLHNNNKSPLSSSPSVGAVMPDGSGAGTPLKQRLEKQTNDLFLTFHCFCTRKDIPCFDITLEDTDIVKSIVEYVNYAAIENLVLGASRGGFIRKFKHSDVPSGVLKGAPDFCNVYVISKGKISSVRNASRSAPHASPLQRQLESIVNERSSLADTTPRQCLSRRGERTMHRHRGNGDDKDSARFRRLTDRTFGDFSESDTDISFVSSERTSTDVTSPLHYDIMDPLRTPTRLSTSSDRSFGSIGVGNKFSDLSSSHDLFSTVSQESGGWTSCSSQMTTVTPDEVEAEMRRLKLELKQTMDLYSTACKEAISAKQKAMELERCRVEEKITKETSVAEEVEQARAKEKEEEEGKSRTSQDNSEAAQRISRLEAERRLDLEMKSITEEPTQSVARYRRYKIEDIEAATDCFAESRKIGEGGYGPVFKCHLDHTPVAVKVLRPDAAQGRAQFQQEVEVLSCIRHPNLVLLLGACPEYGCLVYEYMAKGSLDDRLFCKGNTPPLNWQLRFRIAAEIATGLHFLHQTKPEPLVHRDLKPANILLDQNYVSKIGDVGLARLVPTSVTDNVTQYRMTSTAGTFCYIDPEYQLTGMLGVKSDVYSLGILLLQLITAKPPMGLAHQVSSAIEKGALLEVLDPRVPDWPEEEVLSLAKMAVHCAEMRRKDRPDLGKVVLPELARLRDLADESMAQSMFYTKPISNSYHSQTSVSTQEVLSDPLIAHSRESSPKGCCSTTMSPTAELSGIGTT